MPGWRLPATPWTLAEPGTAVLQPCSNVMHAKNHAEIPQRGIATLPSPAGSTRCGPFPNQVILHPQRCLHELSCSHSPRGKANPAGLENLRLNLFSVWFEARIVFPSFSKQKAAGFVVILDPSH